MSINLYDYLKERGYKGLSIKELYDVTRQILTALAFIKEEVRCSVIAYAMPLHCFKINCFATSAIKPKILLYD